MVGAGSFHLPQDLFHSTLLYSVHFSSSVTVCFKNGTFSLYLGRESHAEIQSRRVFSLNLCGIQTSKQLTWPSWCKWFSVLDLDILSVSAPLMWCNTACVLSHSVVSNSLSPHGLQHARLLCPQDSPGKNTAVGCHFLLHGIFPIQGSNPHVMYLLHWQADSLQLSHLGSWV